MYRKIILSGVILFGINAQANSVTKAVENKANKIIKDVKKDGTNVNFNISLESYQIGRHVNDNLETEPGEYISENPQSRQFATFGASFLPNTWKVNVSYTTLVASNSIYFWGDHSDINNEFKQLEPGLNYIVKDKDKVNFFEIYTKPITTSYGNIGIGYKLTETVEEFIIRNGAQLIDRPTTNPGDGILRLGVKKTKYTVDFDNDKKGWKRLFGLKYAYETSNGLQVKDYTKKEFIHKPDTTSHIISAGYNKTLDEIKTGWDFKELYMGYRMSKHEYHNYLTNKNESIDDSGIDMSFDAIYMFKPRKDKQFYVSLRAEQHLGDYMRTFAFNLKAGLVF
jgi:hypothetical protein